MLLRRQSSKGNFIPHSKLKLPYQNSSPLALGELRKPARPPLRVRSYGGRVSSCRALHVHCSSTQPRRLKPVGSRDGRRVLVDLATREQHANSPRCHEPFLSQTQATVCLRLAEEGCIFVREPNLELSG